MGFTSRRPILPAPTESLVDGSADEAGPTTDLDFETDLSRQTEKTSETIPDDGRPITISTAPKHKSGKLSKSSHQSQTSLLIEYFEAGKAPEGGQRRPSLRVRYTPSHSRKNKEKGDGHILVTEEKTARRPSLSHHIPLGGNETLATNVIEGSISSLDTADDYRPSVPVEIEVLQHDDSDRSILSPPPDIRSFIQESDISSMPAESSLGPNTSFNMAPSSVSIGRGIVGESSSLKPPMIPADRNASNERITQKVIEKLSNKPRVSSSGKRHHSSHSGSRSSVSREVETANTEPRIRVTKTVDDDSLPSATGSSLISGSHLSADPRGIDQRSVQSGKSTGSITNNPKLLQTVEDAIRRLILPELNELRRDQKHSHRSRNDKYSNPSDISSSSVSREERELRKSSGSKSKRRVSRESESGLPSESRRHRRHKTTDYDSPSEQSYEQSESHDSVRDEKRSHKHKSHRTRDVAAGALGAAALTAAALKSHDSGSSLEYSEHRKRRRSKSRSSRSASASIAEKDDAFQKHQVPPMPFVSEIGTDLTRSSLKSSNDGRAETPTREEVRDVIRGSPLELSSPRSQTTPTGNGFDLKRGLGTHHGNFSEHDLSSHDLSSRRETLDEEALNKPRASDDLDFATHGFAALTDPERARRYEENLHSQHPIRRGLSPIQSVASYATTEANRNSMMHQRSSDSLHSPGKHHNLHEQISVSSLSSAPSTDLARSRRPHGMSLESRSEVMAQHAPGSLESTPRQMDPQAVFDEQHLENESYRDSPYIDKVTAGQQVVAKGLGATIEYYDMPMGVESAVASLIEPSIVSVNQTYSPRHSQADSFSARGIASPQLSHHDYLSRHSGSPLKQPLSHHSGSVYGDTPAEMDMVSSPLQSPAHSLQHFEDAPIKFVQPATLATKNVPSGQVERSPESDITTNPSIIRGPIGGLAQGNTEHWPYDPTPPHSRANLVLPPVSRDIGSAGADLIPEPLSTNRDPDSDAKRDLYMQSRRLSTPVAIGDEGYETGANVPTPGLYPQDRELHEDTITPGPQFDNVSLGDDPFTTQQGQYVSGLDHGLSPLYDSATGHGRENIQSKDIVALMDHLTMRDAQRNARDTEILVTLVRSAAEVRNHFEDMRKFIADQGDNIIDNTEKQHERTQKTIGGPRPQPITRPTMSATSEDDNPSKRRNVFQRALRGLGAKNSAELQNIESMLMRLLDEVEGLRGTQPAGVAREPPRSTSLTSADNARAPTDTGYEPEGQAGTSSTGDRSGFFSNNSSRQADYRNYSTHRDSGNRVSTVMEGDEEYDEYGNDLGNDTSGNIQQAASQTPHTTPPRNAVPAHTRGSSVPLHTPPRLHNSNMASLSNENTPHLSTGEGSGKKHKSFASSFLPKMVSRWSKTTTSSENYRASQQRVRPYSEHSRSGSNVGEYDYEHDPQGDDRIRSNTSLQRDRYEDENRPPSPLIPSQVSDNPKYQAHRNSINLQHPQPRQGPSGRFQSRLETEAQNYGGEQLSPTSQTSSQWEANSGLHPQQTNTSYGGHLSPISDAAYSAEQSLHGDNRSIRTASSHGPPRPPKIPNDGPLVPQRPPKVMMSPPSSNRQPTYVDHVAAARAGSPAFDKSPVSALRSPQSQGRKPSGPRPLAGSGVPKGDSNSIKRTRFRGSPNQIDSEDEAASVY